MYYVDTWFYLDSAQINNIDVNWLYFVFVQTKGKHSLVTSLNYMVPVRARRQIIYPSDKLGGNNPSERVLKQQVPTQFNFSFLHKYIHVVERILWNIVWMYNFHW